VSPNGRVVGMLAVSRAFGDLDLQPFISADPYVDVIDIADPPDFLIMVRTNCSLSAHAHTHTHRK
jgi:hypothetical protein